MRFIHVSGNPGIGKSCSLWYVLSRLFDDGETVVIVELVKGTRSLTVDTFVFKQDGTYEMVDRARLSPEYHRPGIWLLTDQVYVGSKPLYGTTVLFASPKEDNWVEAEKTMQEREFTTLYMPPWSVDELQSVYFSIPENKGDYTEFWARYYVAGPIVRYYFMSLKKAYSKILMALTEVVSTGVVNTDALDYSSIKQIHSIVRSRMDGAVDKGACKFDDMKRQEMDFAEVLMRQGKGSIQYEEEKDGVLVFGAWIEVVRTKEGSEIVEKTVLDILSTAGKLAGRELTVFVNERDLDGKFSEPLVLNMLDGTSRIFDVVYELCWTAGATASVVIKSSKRASRMLKLVFPEGEEEGEEEEEDYMEL